MSVSIKGGLMSLKVAVVLMAMAFLMGQTTTNALDNSTEKLENANHHILKNNGSNSLGLEILSFSNGEKLIISSQAGTPAYEVIKLENPNRIAIDFLGVESEKNENFATPFSKLVSGIRVGKQNGRSRVVLDLADGRTITDSISIENGNLVVSLQDSTTLAASAEKDQMANFAQPENFPAESGSGTTTAAILRNELPEGSAITSLDIKNLGTSGNSLVAALTSISKYSLKKTAPSEYVLTLEDTNLPLELQQTIISPPGIGAIRSVRPLASEGDVKLRIFAQPEASLVATTDASSIVVVDSNTTQASNVGELTRAQAAMDALAATQTQAALEGSQATGQTPPPAPADKTNTAAAPGAGENSSVDAKDGASSGDEELKALVPSSSGAYSGRLISLDLQDTDIDNALRIIAEVSNLNIIASDDVTGKVTLRLIDVPWDQALDVILRTNGLDKVQEGNVVRIAPVEKLRQERESLKQAKQAEEDLEPLNVKYIRISYAKASAIKPILDTVITERGSIAFDERTNQIIVKDISRGVKNVSELAAKLDLRTPQVLLETQIVEANRGLIRNLGSQLGFSYIASPETGNATGANFPNSIKINGANGGYASSYPVSADEAGGTAISMIFDSADGTRSLSSVISAIEKEGKGRVVSRPAVATTNNVEASIESTTTIRVKKPSNGASVSVGANSSSAGSGDATEEIKAGIRLTVTPQASPDYFVLLDIAAESSTFDWTHKVDDIPATTTRKANSTVLVSSGQTFAMGGIYKTTDNSGNIGTPFFKDIPVLGTFFRINTLESNDEELLFFITPRIVEGSFDDAAMKVSS